MSETPVRRCQLHNDEDRAAVARLSTRSVANTPLVYDLCESCLTEQLKGFAMFGVPADSDIRWFDESARDSIDDEVLLRLEDNNE